jgi:hypothetical protein
VTKERAEANRQRAIEALKETQARLGPAKSGSEREHLKQIRRPIWPKPRPRLDESTSPLLAYNRFKLHRRLQSLPSKSWRLD